MTWRRVLGGIGAVLLAALTLSGYGQRIGDAAWNRGEPWFQEHVLGNSPPPPGLLDTLDGALAEAQRGRMQLDRLLAQVKRCDTTPKAAADEARRIGDGLRKAVEEALTGVSPDGVERGDRLLFEFRLAMKDSANADSDYAGWAESVPVAEFSSNSNGECGVAISGGDERLRTDFASDSSAATDHKKRFVGIYNPIAKRYGLRQWGEYEF